MLGELLAQIVEDCLEHGESVDLDGLGEFRRSAERGLEFIPESAPRVFIAYVAEDVHLAVRLFDDLEAAGMKPWIDRRKLLPGQNWRQSIERAIQRADFFVACYSRRAVRKRGQFPYEVRLALRCADRMPLGEAFILPVRLERCTLPPDIESQIQYVDLFPDWAAGTRRLIDSILREYTERNLRDAT